MAMSCKTRPQRAIPARGMQPVRHTSTNGHRPLAGQPDEQEMPGPAQHELLHLQRTIGNQAVSRLLASSPQRPIPRSVLLNHTAHWQDTVAQYAPARAAHASLTMAGPAEPIPRVGPDRALLSSSSAAAPAARLQPARAMPAR